MRLLAPSLAFGALAVPCLAQQTWTVDDDAPADFAAIQAAVDAASDGDTIVVRAGTYPPVTIDGKGLTLQADGPVIVQVAIAQFPTLTVGNIAADQELYVRGFELSAFATFETTTVTVDNCAGAVLFEDVVIQGAGTPLVARNCASLTLSRCDLNAPPTFANFSAFTFFGFAAYTGLAAIDSTVFLYGCDVLGSQGYDAYQDFFIAIPPAPAGPALRVTGSTVTAVGSTFTGGDGGGGTATLCHPGEEGEPGIIVSGGFVNPSGTARLLDCTVIAGTGGAGSCGNPDGSDAQPIVINSGTVEDLPGTARAFFGDSPAVEGGVVGVHLAGEPGDTVILHVQLDAAPGMFLADYALAFHLALPTAVVGLGAIPASGMLDLAIPTPALSAGIDSFRFVGQALFIGSSGFFEGGPSTLLLVDSAL